MIIIVKKELIRQLDKREDKEWKKVIKEGNNRGRIWDVITLLLILGQENKIGNKDKDRITKIKEN